MIETTAEQFFEANEAALWGACQKAAALGLPFLSAAGQAPVYGEQAEALLSLVREALRAYFDASGKDSAAVGKGWWKVLVSPNAEWESPDLSLTLCLDELLGMQLRQPGAGTGSEFEEGPALAPGELLSLPVGAPPLVQPVA